MSDDPREGRLRRPSSDPPKLLDAVTIRRWLTALSLASSAEDLSARLSSVTAAAALVSADTASEAIMGILADFSGQPSGKRDAHEDLLGRSQDMATQAGSPMTPTLVRSIRLTHSRRNAIVHQGDEAAPRDVEEGLIVVRELLAVLAASIPFLTQLSAGSGVLTAVSTLVDAPELAERLASADEVRDWRTALEHASVALAMALGRVVPPLGGTRRTHMPRLDRDRALDEAFDVTNRRISRLDAWLVPMALGMVPVDYQRLVESIGGATETLDGKWHPRVSKDATEADSRWILDELARVVFRLWEMRSLVGGDRAQVYLRQQFPSR
jgi:hypothetical protein